MGFAGEEDYEEDGQERYHTKDGAVVLSVMSWKDTGWCITVVDDRGTSEGWGVFEVKWSHEGRVGRSGHLGSGATYLYSRNALELSPLTK
jgi:hypothetical protein